MENNKEKARNCFKQYLKTKARSAGTEKKLRNHDEVESVFWTLMWKYKQSIRIKL